MTKSTHTHTGTCQACGAVQAVDNTSGLVAKHGYKVAGFGFFNGTCQGSGHKPAERDITLTYRIMISCEDWAVSADRLAGMWRDGVLMVTTHESATGKRDAYHRRTYHDVMMFGCSEYDIGRRRGQLEYAEESQAKSARAHAEALLNHVIPRFGRELYPVKKGRTFEKGDTVLTKFGHRITLTTEYYSGFHNRRRVSGWKGVFVDVVVANAEPRQYFISMVELRKYNI